ncbi:MAG: hypothetical protein HGA25_02425, partial [Clostridiales bacterium]|nr:hypothetical protein [Clostridiales bacterium]
EKAINRFRYAREHLDNGIKKQMMLLEQRTGKVFGNPENPLLVSVRSGGAISMPGMMTSFLNVGINETILAGLIKQTAKPAARITKLIRLSFTGRYYQLSSTKTLTCHLFIFTENST